MGGNPLQYRCVPSPHDGTQNRDPLNLIFPVYFDLMRQFSPISPEGTREVFLH
jgi:hypothetical protein